LVRGGLENRTRRQLSWKRRTAMHGETVMNSLSGFKVRWGACLFLGFVLAVSIDFSVLRSGNEAHAGKIPMPPKKLPTIVPEPPKLPKPSLSGQAKGTTSISIGKNQPKGGRTVEFDEIRDRNPVAATTEQLRELSKLRDRIPRKAEEPLTLNGPIAPEPGDVLRHAAWTYWRLVELATAVQGPTHTPPDVRFVNKIFDELRMCPALKQFANELQPELAVRTFLDGHPEQARKLLPVRSDSQPEPPGASALCRDVAKALRDMQASAAEPGAFTTWPLQNAHATAPIQRDGGPHGLRMLLPDAPEGVSIRPSGPSNLPALPLPPPLARKLDEVRATLLPGIHKLSTNLRNQLQLQSEQDRLPATVLADDVDDLHFEINHDLVVAADIVNFLAVRQLDGIVKSYPQLVAACLRPGLTAPERLVVREMRRTGATPEQLVDHVTQDRLKAAARLVTRVSVEDSALASTSFNELKAVLNDIYRDGGSLEGLAQWTDPLFKLIVRNRRGAIEPARVARE
jgi:hypothetical protein